MLTSIVKETKEKVLASEVSKAHGPFECPDCLGQMFLVKGFQKKHHFRHKSLTPNCSYADYERGESELHQNVKESIYKALREEGIESELEKRLVGDDGKVNIADVWAVINNQQVAIEIQRSNLTVEQIEERTKRYAEKNIAVIWIIPEKPTYFITLKSYVIWLQLVQGGFVYYYDEGLTLEKIHYEENEMSRSDKHGKVNLITDFIAVDKESQTYWNGGNWLVKTGNLKLWIDNKPEWWITREMKSLFKQTNDKVLDLWRTCSDIMNLSKYLQKDEKKQVYDLFDKMRWWNDELKLKTLHDYRWFFKEFNKCRFYQLSKTASDFLKIVKERKENASSLII